MFCRKVIGLQTAYLTDRQIQIWKLRLDNHTKAEIGRILGVTRQAIYDAEKNIYQKIENALKDAANAGMVEILYLDSTLGILLGTLPPSGNKVIITFSMKNGVQTWHSEEPNCPKCTWVNRCRNRLLDEAKERNLVISKDESKLPPSELSTIIFRELIPEGEFNR
jgi:DNA-binding CsgD family transcriptional regulator